MLLLDSVSYQYPNAEKNSLTNVSFTLEKGKILSIIGPNGSGKSTLLSVISGFLKPKSGSVLIHKESVHQIKNKHATKIAYLQQFERFPYQYSVLEYLVLARAPHLDFFASPKKEDYEIALDSLHKTNAIKLKDRHIDELSGGELSLVRIARALTQEAEIILMDESVGMLDPANAMIVSTLIRTLANTGMSMLISTHDPVFALHCADFTLALKNGISIAFGKSNIAQDAQILSEVFSLPYYKRTIVSPYANDLLL